MRVWTATPVNANLKYSKIWWNKECSRLVANKRRCKNLVRRRPIEVNKKEVENEAKIHIEK